VPSEVVVKFAFWKMEACALGVLYIPYSVVIISSHCPATQITPRLVSHCFFHNGLEKGWSHLLTRSNGEGERKVEGSAHLRDFQ